ncbi:MAG: DUF2155 domain-containing protein [Alphaproteobacteria bacterium]|nr:DUF2155 domain-containing protein [Alphaproteobacteria bacterium]
MKNSCLILAFFTLFLAFNAAAKSLDKNTAKMQAMDKITGRVNVINVPVNGAVNFGSLSIVVRSCKTRSPEETPDNFAFVDISDKTLDGQEVNIFKGWMISSSPATHAVEHPIYDVWLLSCYDGTIEPADILSPDILALRDNLPKVSEIEAKPKTTVEEPLSEMRSTQHRNSYGTNDVFSFDEEEEIFNLGNITPDHAAADSPADKKD